MAPIVVFVVALAAAAAASFSVGRASAPDARVPLFSLLPGTLSSEDSPNAAVARSIVLGQARKDGMTFGEFVTRRLRRMCGAETNLSMLTSADGPGVGGAYLWIVHGLPEGRGCPAIGVETHWLAGVWSDNGEVIGLGGQPLVRERRVDPEGERGSRTLRKQPTAERSWFTSFMRGASP